MRIILFLLLVICLGTSSYAQEKSRKMAKVKVVTMPLTTSLTNTSLDFMEFPTVAGIYKLKRSRIKTALSFRHRKHRVKLA